MNRLDRLMRLRYLSPPPTLQVVFDGDVVAELSRVQGKYFFQYMPAFKQRGLAPLPGLKMDEVSVSEELFPFFAERIPDMRRPEIREWVKQMGIDETDKLALLGALGRRSVTDSFELRLNKAA